jgi:type I restriction enzyme S subunit
MMMSKLQELIQELCPKGVEFKRLGEVVTIKNGKDYKHLPSGDIPVYGSGGIMTYVNTSCYDKPTVLLPRKGSIGKIYYVDTPFWNVDTVYYTEIRSDVIIPKFLYYFLTTIDLESKNVGTGAIPSLTQAVLYRIEIPLPPLAVQEEIVRILDCFSAYTAELQAELQARKEQYEYYRNKLLSFNPSAQGSGIDGEHPDELTTWGGHSYKIYWKNLGEICSYPKKRISVKSLSIENYVSVENLLQNKQGVKKLESMPMIDNAIEFIPNDILIGNIRPYLKKIWRADCTGGTNGDVLVFRIKESYNQQILPQYLFYQLASDNYFHYMNQYAKGAKMPRGDKNKVLEYAIPIPPLSEQQRIVSILDRFESLVNDLTTGLPAEIEARRQQYEYYRNQLLTFKRLA